MSSIPYTAPAYNLQAFNCPFCNAFANQLWVYLHMVDDVPNSPSSQMIYAGDFIRDTKAAECFNCKKASIWFNEVMVYPNQSIAPLANPDMPEDVKLDFDEAREIVSKSPRGAVALLRLVVQKLCKHLGEPGENINTDIASLVQKGLPIKLQQALDSVRVVGNNAVHPGKIDLKDDVTTAVKLFAFINIICDNQITQPKHIEEFYNETIPDNLKQAIVKRDTPKTA